MKAFFEDEFSIDWVFETQISKVINLMQVITEFNRKRRLDEKRPGIYRFKNKKSALIWYL